MKIDEIVDEAMENGLVKKEKDLYSIHIEGNPDFLLELKKEMDKWVKVDFEESERPISTKLTKYKSYHRVNILFKENSEVETYNIIKPL